MNERLKGLLVKTTLFAAGTAIAVEGCGGNNTPTVKTEPTHQPAQTLILQSAIPSVTAYPEITINPSPSGIANVTPTPEVTATPKPVTLESILGAANHPAVSAETMANSINAAVKENFNAVYPVYKSPSQVQSDINMCDGTTSINGDTGKLAIVDRQAVCNVLATVIWDGYKHSGDPKYLIAFKNLYGYLISPTSGLGSNYKDALDTYLKLVS